MRPIKNPYPHEMTRAAEAARVLEAWVRHFMNAIHGSPMSRNAAMKITPKTAPMIQKSFAGR